MPDPPAGDIVHALKYGGWRAIAPALAQRMSRLSWPADVAHERSLIVPVPLAPDRRRARGFNQSALMAAALATAWDVPMLEVLRRTRATETQTQLTPGDRIRNVAGAFAATVPKRELAGRHVVLVDDVVTTCATLNSCAAALFEGGARIISYVTFGRARAAGDRH